MVALHRLFGLGVGYAVGTWKHAVEIVETVVFGVDHDNMVDVREIRVARRPGRASAAERQPQGRANNSVKTLAHHALPPFVCKLPSPLPRTAFYLTFPG